MSAISKYDSFKRKIRKQDGKEYVIDDDTKDASHLIKVLADPTFCKVIVTKNPLFSIHLFRELGTQKINGDIARPLVWAIIKEALNNKDSILYREQSYNGLGLFKAFMKASFANDEFNNSMLPLSNWSPVLEKNLDVESFQLYTKCFLMLVDSYIREERYYEHSFAVYSPGRSIFEFSGYSMSKIDTFSSEDVYSSFPAKILHICSDTVRDVIKKLEDAKLMEDKSYSKYVKELDTERDYTIVKQVAEWTYELLESASHTRKYDFQLRSSLISLWMDIYPVHGGEGSSELQKEIQRRLEIKIFKQLEVNIIEGYYPAISRPIISILGIKEPDDITIDSEEVRFQKKFYKYIKKHFRALYLKDKDMALDKLPSDVEFDEEKSCLVQDRFKGREPRTLNID